MANILQQYAENELKIYELEQKNKAIKKDAEKELKTYENRIATVLGVKFHFGSKLQKTFYPDSVQKILDDLKGKIDAQKSAAEESGLVRKKYSTVLEVEILDKKKDKKK